MRFNIAQTISPSNLVNVRILQVVLAVIYLILLCYCGVHHGWWLNFLLPLGFGSMSYPSTPSLLYTFQVLHHCDRRITVSNLPLHVRFIVTTSSHCHLHCFSAMLSCLPESLHIQQRASNLCKLLSLHSFSIAPHHPNRHPQHSQTVSHTQDNALHPSVPFSPRALRIFPHRILVCRLRHYAVTKRKRFQAALPKTTVRAVGLCGCARCD